MGSTVEHMFTLGKDARPHAPADPVATSASRLWTERVNPVWWRCRTPLGEWLTEDRVTWRTEDGHWVAQIQRSANRRRVFLRLWQDTRYMGYQDDAGWHAATPRTRRHEPHAVLRSLPLPLPLAS
jgi:hypothetical protein